MFLKSAKAFSFWSIFNNSKAKANFRKESSGFSFNCLASVEIFDSKIYEDLNLSSISEIESPPNFSKNALAITGAITLSATTTALGKAHTSERSYLVSVSLKECGLKNLENGKIPFDQKCLCLSFSTQLFLKAYYTELGHNEGVIHLGSGCS